MKPKHTIVSTEFILVAIFLIGVIVIAVARPEALAEYKETFITTGGVIGLYSLSRGIDKNGNGK